MSYKGPFQPEPVCDSAAKCAACVVVGSSSVSSRGFTVGESQMGAGMGRPEIGNTNYSSGGKLGNFAVNSK